MQQIRLRITGHVQGVGYRYTAAREATGLGLGGWVRNTADGAVELLAVGEPAVLERLLAWCRRGPPGARVAAVDVQWSTPTEVCDDFQIRR